MSLVTSSCLQIANSPLNTSKSKQLYTFSKSDRFKEIQKPYTDKIQYDLPPVISQRKAAIGYGNKYDFTKLNVKNPAPNNYKIEGDFDLLEKKKRGFQFGVSREQMASTGILGNLNKANPGPGSYSQPSTISHVKWTFRQRTAVNDPMNITGTARKNPGPNQYVLPPTLNEKGVYFNSKFSNSKSITFNPPRSKRFPETTKNSLPGPGQYDMSIIRINTAGKYFVSGFKSSKCRTFSHDIRRTLSQGTFLQTPGPGAYRAPSEFGFYESQGKSKPQNMSQTNTNLGEQPIKEEQQEENKQ